MKSFENLKTPNRSFSQWMTVFFSGLCMGAADIAPGISGGTVAFIIGVYPELLQSLKSFDGKACKSLLSLHFGAFFRAVNWQFLLVLISGIAVSFLTLAQLFHDILGDEVYRIYLYSGFLGLILASAVFCARLLSSWKPVYLLIFLIGILIAYFLTDVKPVQKEGELLYNVEVPLTPSVAVTNYKNQQLLNVSKDVLSTMLSRGIITKETVVEDVLTLIKKPAYEVTGSSFGVSLDFMMVLGGAIAISAMLLPGISGSYMLTILGMYGTAIAALADFSSGLKNGVFEIDAFFILASLGIGIVLGAILFSRVVSWALQHFHDGTIAVLTGFMVGALGSVWPFWTYSYYYMPLKLGKGPQLQVVDPILPDFYSPLFFKACFFAILGFAAVFILEWIAGRRNAEKKRI